MNATAINATSQVGIEVRRMSMVTTVMGPPGEMVSVGWVEPAMIPPKGKNTVIKDSSVLNRRCPGLDFIELFWRGELLVVCFVAKSGAPTPDPKLIPTAGQLRFLPSYFGSGPKSDGAQKVEPSVGETEPSATDQVRKLRRRSRLPPGVTPINHVKVGCVCAIADPAFPSKGALVRIYGYSRSKWLVQSLEGRLDFGGGPESSLAILSSKQLRRLSTKSIDEAGFSWVKDLKGVFIS